ncbi:MAG: hypothetical protein C5B57_08455 [Blastocatellia bacterium]|nr:MAG: hypothetical protein C5B57_08455 [Blastocatellia bacterium]
MTIQDAPPNDNAHLNSPVPNASAFDPHIADLAGLPGVAFSSLDPGTVIVVKTRHTCYRLVVVDGPEQRAVVTGGWLFPESTEVRVDGATSGGSVLKMGWIGVGLRLELSIGLRRITTSRVRSIVVEDPTCQALERLSA